LEGAKGVVFLLAPTEYGVFDGNCTQRMEEKHSRYLGRHGAFAFVVFGKK
jgi:hypothetical protein